jgi:hypothetical protein
MKGAILEYIDNLYTLWVLIRLWWIMKKRKLYFC